MSDGPDLLERTRMALAEVGANPLDVRWHPMSPGRLEACFGSDEHSRTMWRAAELARCAEPDHEPRCWACVSVNRDRPDDAVYDNCSAYLPLTEDCGVSR